MILSEIAIAFLKKIRKKSFLSQIFFSKGRDPMF